VIRIRAHAKLNLALRVGPLGADGFHPLATVFQTISLADLLYAGRGEGRDRSAEGAAAGRGATAGKAPPDSLLRLTVSGAVLPEDNTVTRAVALLAEHLRTRGAAEPAPLWMHLVKRIPAGSGLGGGSSDAVAALAACTRLWEIDRDALQASGELQRIAATVGSDVPFFLTGGTALGTGRGDRIEPLAPLPATWLAVAAPPIEVASAAAYAELDRLRASGPPPSGSTAAGPAPAAHLDPGLPLPEPPPYRPVLEPAWMGNDLATAVCLRHPRVEHARRALLAEGAGIAQMTGSGAASFGAFASRREAARAARALRAAGYWAGAFVSISAAQHLRATAP
jgi:4-diphosphocytidyl-2-C-methyl-D-erythritol kinase